MGAVCGSIPAAGLIRADVWVWRVPGSKGTRIKTLHDVYGYDGAWNVRTLTGNFGLSKRKQLYHLQ